MHHLPISATGLIGAAALSLGALLVCATPANATPTDEKAVDPKVTLCHATGSSDNPFVAIRVSAAGAYDGHYKPSDEEARDIIPPFRYEGYIYSRNWEGASEVPVAAEGYAPELLRFSSWEPKDFTCEDIPQMLGAHSAAGVDGSVAPVDEGATPEATESPVPSAAAAAAAAEPAGDGSLPAYAEPAVPSAGELAAASAEPVTAAAPLAETAQVPVASAGDGALGAAKLLSDEAAEAPTRPGGGVAAGDGSFGTNEGRALPYAIGGATLAAAAGAAFAARRSSRTGS